MPEREAFLHRISHQPEDDDIRLIFADWLDERADPLGEFIRLQYALAALDSDDPRRFALRKREQTLLTLHSEQWASPVRGLTSAVEFRRGFVEVINIETRRFLNRAEELFQLAPIRQIRFLDVGSSLPRLVEFPYLARLDGITLYAQHLGDRLTRALADSPHLTRLRSLELGRNRLGDAGLEALAHSPFLTGLQRLDLSENQIGDVGAAALAAATSLPALHTLQLQNNELTADGLATLVRSARLMSLTTLGVRENRIATRSSSSSREHVTTPPRLRTLDLRTNHIAPSELAYLVSLPELASLHRLDLAHNPLGSLGARVLADSPQLTRLRALWLDHADITDAAVRHLAESDNLLALSQLELSDNPLISDFGAQAILDPRRFRNLRRLGVPRQGLSPRVRRLLQARFAPLGVDRAM